MTKYIEEAKVVGQRILNATTKQIDLIAPRIAAEAVPGQFVNVQVSQRTAPLAWPGWIKTTALSA